jgi:hypothetical protein
MHMMKKWLGSPSDRRKDRRKVAIAAAAAFLLFVTSAQAGVVDFVLDPQLSSLSRNGSTVDLHNFGGPVNTPYTSQTDLSGGGATGLNSFFSGDLYVDIQPGSIKPLIGYQSALGSATAPTGPLREGAFIPNMPISNAQPSGPPNPAFGGAPADYGDYGIRVAAIGAFARQWDINIGPTPLLGAAGPMPLVAPNTYAVATQIWGYNQGYQALSSGLGGAVSHLSTVFSGAPFPIPLSGTFDASLGGSPVYTPGSGVATWDGTTLTINVNGKVTYNIQGSNGSADQIADSQVLVGTLVYHPAVPEPSSLLMLGCGIVGLASYAWRNRKRQG